MLPEAIALMLGPATLLSQMSVNLLRMAFPDGEGGTTLNHWVSPIMAVLLGIVFSFLLLLIMTLPINPQTCATAVVAGFMAGAAAMGVTQATRSTSGVSDANRLRIEQELLRKIDEQDRALQPDSPARRAR